MNNSLAAGLVGFFCICADLGAQPLKSCVQTPTLHQKDSCARGIAEALETSNKLLTLHDGWTLARSKGLADDPDVVSIMHMADPTRSDFGLAGISISCGKNRREMMIILLNSVPVSARPSVTVESGGQQRNFSAAVLPGRRSLRLTDFSPNTALDWLQSPEILTVINIDQNSIRGVIPMAGLSRAMAALDQACVSQ